MNATVDSPIKVREVYLYLRARGAVQRRRSISTPAHSAQENCFASPNPAGALDTRRSRSEIPP
jgi:hypothetical protein